MKLFLLSAVLFIAPLVSPANAEELPPKELVSPECASLISEFNIKEYHVEEPHWSDPLLQTRDGVFDVTVSPVGFNSLGAWGLLFVYDSQEYLHCFTVQNVPNFILEENVKKQFLFDPYETEVIEFHIHYFVNCGVPCHRARVDTIVFPYMMYPELGGRNPSLVNIVSTEPNHYPSKWFRGYLTASEKNNFDNQVGN